MEIAPNCDDNSFYLSFGFSKSFKTRLEECKKEKFFTELASIMHYVFDSLDILVTSRLSFGFPIHNLTVCVDHLRFTIGIFFSFFFLIL